MMSPRVRTSASSLLCLQNQATAKQHLKAFK
jgi:hypothetical protein